MPRARLLFAGIWNIFSIWEFNKYQHFPKGPEICSYTRPSVGPDSGLECTLRDFVFRSLCPEPSIHNELHHTNCWTAPQSQNASWCICPELLLQPYSVPGSENATVSKEIQISQWSKRCLYFRTLNAAWGSGGESGALKRTRKCESATQSGIKKFVHYTANKKWFTHHLCTCTIYVHVFFLFAQLHWHVEMLNFVICLKGYTNFFFFFVICLPPEFQTRG